MKPTSLVDVFDETAVMVGEWIVSWPPVDLLVNDKLLSPVVRL